MVMGHKNASNSDSRDEESIINIMILVDSFKLLQISEISQSLKHIFYIIYKEGF